MTLKRQRIFWVTPEFLVDLCKPGPPRFAQAVESPLPADARVVRTFYDPQRTAVGIVVSSEEFEPVAEGAVIPEHPPTQWLIVEPEGS